MLDDDAQPLQEEIIEQSNIDVPDPQSSKLPWTLIIVILIIAMVLGAVFLADIE